KDRWLAIRKGNRTAYAQWEDCGPFRTDHFQYVFQNERPKANLNRGAGLDVSPAGRDYLGLGPTDVTDWQFVEVRDVPPGPWRNYGDNNHFVIAKRQSEQSLAKDDSDTRNRKKELHGACLTGAAVFKTAFFILTAHGRDRPKRLVRAFGA